MEDDDTLYRIIKKNRGENLLLAWDCINEKDVVFNLSDVIKRGYKAWSIKEVAAVLNRRPMTIQRIIKEGYVPNVARARTNGRVPDHARYYFTKKAIFQAHKAISMRNIQKANKGFVKVSDIPTKDELKAQLDHDLILYATNEDGEFVRVWEAEEW